MWKHKPFNTPLQVPDLLFIKKTLSAIAFPGNVSMLLLLLVLPSESFSQEKYLVMDKPGHIKRIRYYTGDEIIFKLKGDKTTYSTIIQAVGDSTIRVRDTDIPVNNIRSIIRHTENGFLYQASRILPKAGILYFLADTFNPIFRGEKPHVSRSGVVVGSTLFLGGNALKLFRKRTLKVNNYRTLKILQTF
jgi:hypothetical protein